MCGGFLLVLGQSRGTGPRAPVVKRMVAAFTVARGPVPRDRSPTLSVVRVRLHPNGQEQALLPYREGPPPTPGSA